jgi:hypothetical protein
MVNTIATQWPELAAGVPFYGMAPPLEDVPKIKAALLLHFAQNDERIDAAWPPYEAALKKAGVRYEAYIYPGTQHGFNNDTTPRYDAKAAALAWSRTLAFFGSNLKAGERARASEALLPRPQVPSPASTPTDAGGDLPVASADRVDVQHVSASWRARGLRAGGRAAARRRCRRR